MDYGPYFVQRWVPVFGNTPATPGSPSPCPRLGGTGRAEPSAADLTICTNCPMPNLRAHLDHALAYACTFLLKRRG